MERVWQRAWDRFGPRYSWAVYWITALTVVPIFAITACLVIAFEGSTRYAAGASAAAVIALVAMYAGVLPGGRTWRLVERAGAGEPVDRAAALAATYAFGRRSVVRDLLAFAGAGAGLGVVSGVIAEADKASVVQWGVAGTIAMLAVQVIPIHFYVEALMRPPRRALIDDTTIGDSMPRSRPTFATWASIAMLATVWVFTLLGAYCGVVVDRASDEPIVAVLIAFAATALFGAPITLFAAFAPSLQPIRDLAAGTRRVAAGEYDQPLPVVQDDDLGVLVAMFNRMQVGLQERQSLHAAFGSYVDPALAQRLLESGSSMFEGEETEVSILFADVRDFTSYAEGVAPSAAVERLNALFDVIVPALQEHGGHANHYLGDGLLAVFGAPMALEGHADAAVGAAIEMQRRLQAEFGTDLRLGIGVNTGPVIAGTVGGGGRHEFTVIGDAVNTAARVEQLTKETGDAILITEATRVALSASRLRSTTRGVFDLKGKSARITVHAINPFPRSTR